VDQWLQLLLWQSQHISNTMPVKIAIRIMKPAGVGEQDYLKHQQATGRRGL
jgi:hypothetical protein